MLNSGIPDGKRSGYYRNLGSLRAGMRHHGEFLRYGNSFPPTFPEDLLAHASPKDWPIISPVLFTIFTNEFTINEDNFRLFKYADDMALVSLLDKTNQRYDLAYLTHKKFKKSFIPNAVRIINSATFN